MQLVKSNNVDYWEERANKVLSNFYIRYPDEIDMYEIIQKYGIRIKPLEKEFCDLDFDEGSKAFSVPKNKGRKGIIYIKPGLDPVEKRMILAEEFSHLYAHHQNELIISGTHLNKIEAQAKRMSAYLLMPWRFVSKLLNLQVDQSILISEIADLFLVTEEFANYRLELAFKFKVDALSNFKGKIRALEVFE
nr:ImmA/IrrE family metallo-endopeptidase [Fredinandcohnia onubensis]